MCTGTNTVSATNCNSTGNGFVMSVIGTGICNANSIYVHSGPGQGRPTAALTEQVVDPVTAPNQATMGYLGTDGGSGKAKSGTMNYTVSGTSVTATFTNLPVMGNPPLLFSGTITCP